MYRYYSKVRPIMIGGFPKSDAILDIVNFDEKKYDPYLGDYAYGKVRLKGFNKKDNVSYQAINDYEKIDEYIKNCCAYECKYFVLQKLND